MSDADGIALVLLFAAGGLLFLLVALAIEWVQSREMRARRRYQSAREAWRRDRESLRRELSA